MIKRRDKEEDI